METLLTRVIDIKKKITMVAIFLSVIMAGCHELLGFLCLIIKLEKE